MPVTIPRGTMLALLGDPGAGAGQVARKVAGVTTAGTGRVLLGGVDASTLSRSELRRLVGYVSPETGFFQGTVRDNLLLGCPTASDDDLWGLLSSMFGDDVRDHLRAGLDTEVDLRGRRLNAGSTRLLAIARAAVRTPDVLVLDRIVDSFDGDALARLVRARTTVLDGITLVVATSRSGIAGLADHVVTVGDGGSPGPPGRSDPSSREPGTSVQHARTPGS
ncbi:MAG TPA: ABC transporter ATP-binding protein [Nitriliruptoraceae bacterium]|nr:ABC transporter ATP-binding protein [Nitriliruptoraceae bacterium]